MRRFGLATIVGLLLVGGAVPAALATTTRIHTATPGLAETVLDPGTTTMNGTVLSVRGEIAQEDGVWNNVYADGLEVDTINYDLDLATGSGSLWGTGIHTPTAFPDATWQCVFHTTFVNFAYAGKGVCQGTGSLHTWQWRVDLTSGPQGTAADGYIFNPGD